MEKAIRTKFPDEVRHVWSRIGTAEIATDPMGMELTDLFVSLKPRRQWTKTATQGQLARLIEKEIRDLPGQKISFPQPIEMRLNEMVSGVRSDVGAIVYGDDLELLAKKAGEVAKVLERIPGNADVAVEPTTGQPVLRVKVNQEELARYGVSARAVLDLVESVGGKPLGEVVEGQLRFPLVVRLPDKHRSSKEASSAVDRHAMGSRIPLAGWRP